MTFLYLSSGMMPKKNENKTTTINLKVSPLTHDEFQLACKLRGATMSGILYLHLEKIIREEKQRDPEAFAEIEAKYHPAAVGRSAARTKRRAG